MNEKEWEVQGSEDGKSIYILVTERVGITVLWLGSEILVSYLNHIDEVYTKEFKRKELRQRIYNVSH